MLKTKTNFLKGFLIFCVIVIMSFGCASLSRTGGLNPPDLFYGYIPQEKDQWIEVEIDGAIYEGKMLIRSDIDLLNIYIESCKQ